MTEQTQPYPGNGSPQTQSSADGDDASVKDKAAESAQAGKQAVGEVAQTAADQAKGVAQEAQAQARNVLGEARNQLQSHAGDQHRNAVNNLRSLSEELRSMADHNGDEGVATSVVSEAAQRAQSAADWLEQRQPGDLVQELRRFARQRPGAFLAGALVAGVIAGRLTRGAIDVHSDDESSTPPTLPSGSQSPQAAAPPAGDETPGFQPPAGQYGTVHGFEPDYGAAGGEPAPYGQPGATGFVTEPGGYPSGSSANQEPWQ
jgi:uncharacterized protein YjbJ (UPF0337 family)